MRLLESIVIYRKRLLFSLGSALLLIVCGYLVNNQPVFTGEDLTIYALLQHVKDRIKPSHDQVSDSVTFINVCYDPQIIEYLDTIQYTQGSTVITDRYKLTELLRRLKARNRYKYIFLDVRFEPGYDTPVDSELFATIRSMDRISVAVDASNPTDSGLIDEKLAYADYFSTIVATNFTRYRYMRDGHVYMPLAAYNEVDKHEIKRYGPLFFDNGRLCQISVFLNFSTDVGVDAPCGSNGYYNMGGSLLNPDPEVFPDEASRLSLLYGATDDSYVVIGDVINDLHDTYSGMKCGPLIIASAYLALKRGDHLVNPWQIAFLFTVYFLITLSMFSSERLTQMLFAALRIKWKWVRFLFTLFSFSVVLFIVEVIDYFLFDVIFSVLIPATYFTIVQRLISYHKFKHVTS